MSDHGRRGRRLESEEELAEVVRSMRTVAVLGMKGDDRAEEPAHSVPVALHELGYELIPVNPTIESSLGLQAFPTLEDVPRHFDLIDVFRRSSNIPRHVDEILALPLGRRPRVVWLQSGIRHDEATERLLEAGIDVVSDNCLGVCAQRFAGRERD